MRYKHNSSSKSDKSMKYSQCYRVKFYFVSNIAPVEAVLYTTLWFGWNIASAVACPIRNLGICLKHCLVDLHSICRCWTDGRRTGEPWRSCLCDPVPYCHGVRPVRTCKHWSPFTRLLTNLRWQNASIITDRCKLPIANITLLGKHQPSQYKHWSTIITHGCTYRLCID